MKAKFYDRRRAVTNLPDAARIEDISLPKRGKK